MRITSTERVLTSIAIHMTTITKATSTLSIPDTIVMILLHR
jgi:hypothetical protein